MFSPRFSVNFLTVAVQSTISVVLILFYSLSALNPFWLCASVWMDSPLIVSCPLIPHPWASPSPHPQMANPPIYLYLWPVSALVVGSMAHLTALSVCFHNNLQLQTWSACGPNCWNGPHLGCISHKRSHFPNYDSYMKEIWNKSGSETMKCERKVTCGAMKKGDWSINQVENKSESMHLLSNGTI